MCVCALSDRNGDTVTQSCGGSHDPVNKFLHVPETWESAVLVYLCAYNSSQAMTETGITPIISTPLWFKRKYCPIYSAALFHIWFHWMLTSDTVFIMFMCACGWDRLQPPRNPVCRISGVHSSYRKTDSYLLSSINTIFHYKISQYLTVLIFFIFLATIYWRLLASYHSLVMTSWISGFQKSNIHWNIELQL